MYISNLLDSLPYDLYLIQAESDPETGVPAHKYSLDKQRVLDEKCCGKISDDLGVIWMVRRGRHDVHEMISMAKEDENNLTKMLRILCWILIVAGWMMLFSIFTTLLNTLPIIGQLGSAAFFIVALIVGTVCCCGVQAHITCGCAVPSVPYPPITCCVCTFNNN